MSDKGTPNNLITKRCYTKKDAQLISGIFVHFVVQIKTMAHRRRVCPSILNYSHVDPTLS